LNALADEDIPEERDLEDEEEKVDAGSVDGDPAAVPPTAP
jgi:hypothetical protein